MQRRQLYNYLSACTGSARILQERVPGAAWCQRWGMRCMRWGVAGAPRSHAFQIYCAHPALVAFLSVFLPTYVNGQTILPSSPRRIPSDVPTINCVPSSTHATAVSGALARTFFNTLYIDEVQPNVGDWSNIFMYKLHTSYWFVCANKNAPWVHATTNGRTFCIYITHILYVCISCSCTYT